MYYDFRGRQTTMSSIGELLRRERVSRNLDLEQISRETKISSRLLQAIEAEQFEKLPGGVFTKSFVRQYARYLGLDEEELVGELERLLEPPPMLESTARHDASDIHVPRVEEWQLGPQNRIRFSSVFPALATVVLVMLACSLVYAWWQRYRIRPAAPVERPAAALSSQPGPPSAAAVLPPSGSAGPASTVPGTPVSEAAGTLPAPATAEPTAPQAVQPASATPAAVSPETESRPPQAQAAPSAAPPVARAPQPVPATAPPAAPPSAASQTQAAAVPKAPPNPNATVHLQLAATEPTWVLVRTDGKYLFSGTLQANETREVEAMGTVLLRLGNAGGVSVTLNGKPLGAVGPKGQVRTVQFTSSGLHTPPPTPKPPAEPTDPL